jgi:hypothetical protein
MVVILFILLIPSQYKLRFAENKFRLHHVCTVSSQTPSVFSTRLYKSNSFATVFSVSDPTGGVQLKSEATLRTDKLSNSKTEALSVFILNSFITTENKVFAMAKQRHHKEGHFGGRTVSCVQLTRRLQ